MRTVSLVIVLLAGLCAAQTPQPPATAEELQYFRFVLLNIASLDHHPSAVKAFEDLLVKQFDLNSSESAAIHAAGQALKPLLADNCRAGHALVIGKSVLSTADLAALRALDTQREQKIASLASQILSAVRPATAARLRAPGPIANRASKN